MNLLPAVSEQECFSFEYAAAIAETERSQRDDHDDRLGQRIGLGSMGANVLEEKTIFINLGIQKAEQVTCRDDVIW